jgi:hypothetical protein
VPDGTFYSLVAGAVALACALMLWGGERAFAQTATPTPCPTAPPVYAGLNETVGELRQLRIQNAQHCGAVASRLDVLDGDGDQARDKLAAIVAAVQTTASRGTFDSPVRVRETHPGATTGSDGPTGPTGSQDDPVYAEVAADTSDQINTSAVAISGAVWFLAGLLSWQLIGGPLLRKLLA